MRTSSSAGFDLWEAFDGLREAFVPRAAGRMGRGDIRTAILVALTEEPMHGYQIINEIAERSGGSWKPSAGSVYPTLQLLADEGLIVADESQGRKSYSLTEAGRAVVDDAEERPAPWASPAMGGGAHRALSKAGVDLAAAAAQLGRSGSPEQLQQAVDVLDDARRKLYTILAEG